MWDYLRIPTLIVVFILLQFIFFARAKGEYRVYRLAVFQGDSSHEEMITLDDLQYRTYLRTNPSQRVRIVDHWMCWGRTDGFKPYCEKPVKPSDENNVSSSNQGQSPVPVSGKN